MEWYLPADDPAGIHFGYVGPRWVSLVPLVLQMALFLILFQAVGSGRFTLLVWVALLTVAAGIAARLVARHTGVGYCLVDEWGVAGTPRITPR